MFPQLVPVPWSQCHHPIAAGSTAGIFSVGAASRAGVWKQAHSGTDLFQQGNTSVLMGWSLPCSCVPLAWLLDTSCPACLGCSTYSWIQMWERERGRLLLCLCSLQCGGWPAWPGAPIRGSFQAGNLLWLVGLRRGVVERLFLGRKGVAGWVLMAAALQKEILFVLRAQIRRVGNVALAPCAHSWFARESCCHGMVAPREQGGPPGATK